MPPAPLRLPPAARFACWFNAWAQGRVSADDARDAVVADDAAHDLVDLPGQPGSVPMIVSFGRLRALGAGSAAVAMPVSGDLTGLAGPVEFNHAALDAGEAVLMVGTGLGLVPRRIGAGVFWAARPASPPPLLDLPETDQALREAVVRCADTLAGLEVGRWQPDVADALRDLRAPVGPLLPPGYPDRNGRTAALALRCTTVAELGLTALATAGLDGVAATAEGSAREALRDLDRAARHALVAACNAHLPAGHG